MKPQTTKLEQVKAAIQRDIINGTYKEKLPGVRVLAKHYDVHFSTVHRALEQLKQDGYLIRMHGSGSYVPPEKRIQSAGILLFRYEDTPFSELSLEVVCRLAEKLLTRNINLQIYSVVLKNDREQFIADFKHTVARMETDLVITFRIPPWINVEEFIDKPVVQISSQYVLRSGYFITADIGWVMAKSLKRLVDQGIKEIGVITPDFEHEFGVDSQRRITSVLQKVGKHFRDDLDVTVAAIHQLPDLWQKGQLPKGFIVYLHHPIEIWLEGMLQGMPATERPKLVFLGGEATSETLKAQTISSWNIPLEDFISSILDVIHNITVGDYGCHTHIMVNREILPTDASSVL